MKPQNQIKKLQDKVQELENYIKSSDEKKKISTIQKNKQAFEGIPKEIILFDDVWKVELVDDLQSEGLCCHSEKKIKLNPTSERIVWVFLHEVGHILNTYSPILTEVIKHKPKKYFNELLTNIQADFWFSVFKYLSNSTKFRGETNGNFKK